MNFILTVKRSQNKWWQYLLSMLLIFTVFIVGNVIMFIPVLGNSQALEHLASGDITALADEIGRNTFLALMLLSFGFALIGLLISVRHIHKRSLKTLFSGGTFRLNRFFYAFGLWIGLSTVSSLIYIVIFPYSFTIQFDFYNLLVLLLIAVLLIPIQAGTEELIFRGYLFQGIGRATRTRWIPLIITSLIFAWGHMDNPEVDEFGAAYMFPMYAIMGISFGLMVLIDDGLESALGAHIANNMFIAVLLNQEGSALPTDSLVIADLDKMPVLDYVVFIAIEALFIFLLIKKHGPGELVNFFKRIPKPIEVEEQEPTLYETDALDPVNEQLEESDTDLPPATESPGETIDPPNPDNNI